MSTAATYINSPVRFSVIIPAYNASATIARAITSCLQQSYPPFEIIVVNDASTDDTHAIIEEQFSAQVQYLRLHTNMGPGFARNKGIATATGNYIAFLDADDIWHTDKLFICQTILAADARIKFLYHAYTLRDIKGLPIPDGTTLYKLPFVKLLYKNLIATPCAVIYNDKHTLFNDDMRYSEDYDLWLQLAYKNKAYFINVPLTQLGRPITSHGGASSNRWKMRKGELSAFTHLFRLNPFFVFLLPFLYTYSIGKHLYKLATGT